MKTLKYSWRFLMRSKSYTIINLLGLACSLACSIILMRYIHRELTVDTHCIDREHVYACLLYTSITEKDTARRNYITALKTYWSLYYGIRSTVSYTHLQNLTEPIP